MKKIFLLLTVFSMVYTSCEPLEDINTEIDADVSAITGDVIYTLTDEDYDTLELSYSFSSEDNAKTALPGFLSDKYPVWGQGSSALISYNLYVGNAEGISDYTGADSYELADLDYANAGIDASTYNVFTSVSPADFNLPSILESNITTPADGDIILAKYKYAEEPSDPSVIYRMENDDYQLIVDRVANNSNPAISDLVTSFGDSELYTGASVYYGNFDTRLNKREGQADYDALTTDEERIAFVDERVQEGIVWFLKSKFPTAVPEKDGQTVFYVITYKTYNGANAEPTVIYKCTASGSGGDDPEFELHEGPGEDVSHQASTVTEDRGDFYSYTGSKWEKISDVYFIGSGDFDSMGEAYGQPGYFNNFGSSTPPRDYVPALLNIKYPYALEGDSFTVVYKYYSSSSGAQLRGNLYTFNAGAWSGYESTQETSLQLAHDGSTWVPDNTIKYEFVESDYTLIADTYRDNPDYASAVANLETYGNISTFNWDEDQIDAAVNTVLEEHFPSMDEDQKFAVTIYVYNGSSNNITINYILSGGVYIRN